MNTPTDRWSFVLSHNTMIRRMSRKFSSRLHNSQDREDFLSDVVARVAAKAHTFDPEKGSAGTWIGWQCRAVQKDYTRAWGKNVARDAIGDPEVLALIPGSLSDLDAAGQRGMDIAHIIAVVNNLE